MKPFIPSWLNTFGLSQSEFRVYCCLASRADNVTGIAWPKADTIAEDCIMARNTVWKSLRTLESKGLIRRVGKPFQGSSRYEVLTLPTGANETPIDSPIGANQIPIESAPIGANETPPIGANEILQSAQSDSRECNPKNVIQGRVSNTLVETIWREAPSKGRERSSKKQLADALKKTKNLPPEEEIIQSLEAWKRSEAWTKDNGQFIPGIHRWVKDEKWETRPEPAPITGKRRGSEERL